MSNKAINYVFENSKTVGSARVLMLAIADMANDDGECWPGKAKLHKKVNVSVRMITRLIQECERLGELGVVAGGEGQTNRYLVIGIAAEQRIEKARPAREKKPRAKRVTSDTGVTSEAQDITGSVPGVMSSSDTGVTQTHSKPTDITHSVQDAKAPASDPSIAKPKVPRKPRPTDAYYEAIVDAFGYDRARITKTQAGNIGKVATELYHAGYDAEDVAEIYKWCKRQKWTGGFTVNALTTQAANWAAARPHRSSTPAMHVPLAEHDDMLDALLEDVG